MPRVSDAPHRLSWMIWPSGEAPRKNRPNTNPDFRTGAWTIHFVLIAALKILYDIMPGVSQETTWTLTNISYMFGSFLMFHWVRAVPFELNAGAYDNLTMSEQITNV